MRKFLLAATALAAPVGLAHPALAAPGDPVKFGNGFAFDPIIDGRLRFEEVDQPTRDAEALTLRLRGGFEIKHKSGVAVLAEAEGSLALNNSYNAFPFAIADSQRRPLYAVVPDPMTVEINRLQFQYKTKTAGLTVGRQRINLDDQRFVGAVGWRQNEQTFDAVRGEAKLGPVSLDATYAISQRTMFGADAGPRQSYDGDFVFAGASARLGPVNAKVLAYLLDYDETFFLTNSSKTLGLRLTGTVPFSPRHKLNLMATFAKQSDMGRNPFDYSASYAATEASMAFGNVTPTLGYELLGADKGRAIQTPMATLHKFNGWADVFLTTPNAGLQDLYAGLGIRFPKVRQLPGLNAAATWHSFRSDVGSVKYGTEWNASLGFRLGRTNLLAKFADYRAKGFGVDTRKLWLQVEFAY